MSRRISLIAPAAVAALVIAGCGGSAHAYSSSAAAKPASAKAKPARAMVSMRSARRAEVLRLSADPNGQLRFTPSKLTARRPGRITLIMRNPSSTGMPHGIAIDGKGVDRDGPIVRPGKTSILTVTLKKGRYTYYCPVPGHRQAGMVGTLTVK